MEFMSRGRGQTPAPQTASGTTLNGDTGGHRGKKRGESSLSRYLFLVLVGGVGIILVLLIVSLFTGNGRNTGQAKYVDESRYQAVFLNNNQVYFGKITKLNNDYMLLDDVFYLQVNQTSNVQPGQSSNNNNNLVLQKLGKGELHSPDDTMVINTSQVTFWENIKNDGKVVEAINKYNENPDAANQSTESNNTNTNTNTNTNKNNNSGN